jgi:carboxylesterase type B
LKELNDNWDVLGPQYLDFNHTIPRDKHVEIARLIKEHYLGTKPIDRYNTAQLVEMASDRFFKFDSEKAARMQAKVNQNPVWYYYYSYRAVHSTSNVFTHNTENYGKSINFPKVHMEK